MYSSAGLVCPAPPAAAVLAMSKGRECKQRDVRHNAAMSGVCVGSESAMFLPLLIRAFGSAAVVATASPLRGCVFPCNLMKAPVTSGCLPWEQEKQLLIQTSSD